MPVFTTQSPQKTQDQFIINVLPVIISKIRLIFTVWNVQFLFIWWCLEISCSFDVNLANCSRSYAYCWTHTQAQKQPKLNGFQGVCKASKVKPSFVWIWSCINTPCDASCRFILKLRFYKECVNLTLGLAGVHVCVLCVSHAVMSTEQSFM